MKDSGGLKHRRILRLAFWLAAVAFLQSMGGCSNWILDVVKSFGTPDGGKISTVAGNGTVSYSGDGGSATSAGLDAPYGVAVDSSGNLYIDDSGNSVIRKVNLTSGIISTVAGKFSLGPGYFGDGGPATDAQLKYPYGIAVDSAGNLYIADTFNNLIRKVNAISGTITTVAGSAPPNNSGTPLGDNGPATSAKLYYPYAVAVDSANNIYIDDYNNNRIRKVTFSTGIISTVAGDGNAGYFGDGAAATAARLDYPWGIAVDSSGNLYIADTSNNAIRKVDTSRNISTVAGNWHLGHGFAGDGNVGTAAMLNNPMSIAIDSSGNLYIADSRNNRVRKVSPGK